MKLRLLIFIMLLGLLMACSKDTPPPTPDPVQQKNPEPDPEPEPVKSSEKQMTGFRFTGLDTNGVTVDIPGEVDNHAKTIAIEMPNGIEITALEPEVEIPDKSVYEPTGPQDFSTPINYTVTAEDGNSRAYLITVAVVLSQKAILLLISAANPDNTLDWKETDNLGDWEEVTLDENWNITALDFLQENLSIIPPEIGQLGNLEVLLLQRNNLSKIPIELWQLTNLKTLNLIENNLSSLPPEIEQLSSMADLYLDNNNLSGLPPEIGQLSSLEGLYLHGNNLSSLPATITQLVKLKTLDLSENNLSQFNHVPFIPSDGITFGCATETNLETLVFRWEPGPGWFKSVYLRPRC